MKKLSGAVAAILMVHSINTYAMSHAFCKNMAIGASNAQKLRIKTNANSPITEYHDYKAIYDSLPATEKQEDITPMKMDIFIVGLFRRFAINASPSFVYHSTLNDCLHFMTNGEAKSLAKGAYVGDKSDLQGLHTTALLGNKNAESWLGTYYYLMKNYNKSDHWLRKAAQQGNSRAEFNLGVAYANGFGLQKSYTKADYWFNKSAILGDQKAEVNLGIAFLKGDGVPANKRKGLYLIKEAAAAGNMHAEKLLQLIDDNNPN